MTEEDDKLVTLKFAIDMRKATRAATIEECAKVAESFISNEGGTESEAMLGPLHLKRAMALATFMRPREAQPEQRHDPSSRSNSTNCPVRSTQHWKTCPTRPLFSGR